eukprot:3935972-Rhodomonas_salina.2
MIDSPKRGDGAAPKDDTALIKRADGGGEGTQAAQDKDLPLIELLEEGGWRNNPLCVAMVQERERELQAESSQA